jgi:hypothetical protein
VSSKAIRGSRGRGALPSRETPPESCEGYPDDGRHSGSSLSVPFHEASGNGGLGGLAAACALNHRTRKSEKSRQECQRLDPLSRAGRKRPRDRVKRIRRSDPECREAPEVPGPALRSPNSARRPRSVSCGESRERARYGYTLSFEWQKSVSRIVALSPPWGRKASRCCKSASPKEALHLVGHEA